MAAMWGGMLVLTIMLSIGFGCIFTAVTGIVVCKIYKKHTQKSPKPIIYIILYILLIIGILLAINPLINLLFIIANVIANW